MPGGWPGQINIREILRCYLEYFARLLALMNHVAFSSSSGIWEPHTIIIEAISSHGHNNLWPGTCWSLHHRDHPIAADLAMWAGLISIQFNKGSFSSHRPGTAGTDTKDGKLLISRHKNTKLMVKFWPVRGGIRGEYHEISWDMWQLGHNGIREH